MSKTVEFSSLKVGQKYYVNSYTDQDDDVGYLLEVTEDGSQESFILITTDLLWVYIHTEKPTEKFCFIVRQFNGEDHDKYYNTYYEYFLDLDCKYYGKYPFILDNRCTDLE